MILRPLLELSRDRRREARGRCPDDVANSPQHASTA